MASANTTNQLPLLKRLWGSKVADPLYKASRFAAMINSDTNFGSEGRYVNVTVGPTAGGSSNFADALAAQDATKEVRFFVTHRKEYQVFSLQGDLIARSKGNANAMVEAVKQQADKARYAYGRSVARKLWGNGGGALGQLATTTVLTGNLLILRSRPDVVGFEVGMQLEFAIDDGSAASPAGRLGAPDRLTILAINRDTGTLTMSGNLNTVTGITVNTFVFRRGDYAQAMTGMRGWNPILAPTAGDSFFGLDRSTTDVTRVTGARVNGGGKPKEETLIDGTAEAQINGITINQCFMNPLDYRDLVKEMGSKREIQVTAKQAGMGFTALEVYGATGTIQIVSEVDVPRGAAWGVDTDQITLRTAGDAPMMLNEDGIGKLVRAADDDAYQGRIGSYGNLFQDNPGNAVIFVW
jgi:hypothetical protein